MVYYARKFVLMIIFTISHLAYVVLFIFIAGKDPWWLGVFAGIYFIGILLMLKQKSVWGPPLVLVILMISIYGQSSFINKTGVTSHTVLQRFAQSIQKEKKENLIVSVGSHDIHEKELQVYFQDKVEKAGHSSYDVTHHRLKELFNQKNKSIYCLIMEKDYNKHLKDLPSEFAEIIQEEYVFRRRLYLDKGFFKALLKLDQPTIHRYLMEKIILVRKEPHV